MNIQKKTFFILVTMIFFYAFILIFMSNKLWNTELVKQDQSEAIKSHEIINSYLNNELGSLSLILKDYSRWDDTFNYIKHKTPSYIKENYLGVDTDNFSYAAVYNGIGQRLASFEINKDGTLKPWNFLPARLNINSLWYDTSINKTKTGFMKADKGILLAASSPVLPNSFSENPNGILIFAKLFNDSLKNSLNTDTKISNQLLDISDTKILEKNLKLFNLIKDSQGVYFDSTEKDLLKSHSLIYDIYGKPLFILSIQTKKQFEISGRKIQNYTVLLTIFFALIILLIISETLQYMIINPLRLLQRIFQQISTLNMIPEGYYKKLSGKHDEISELAEEFKIMNDKIFDLNHNLENIVKERTFELSKTNDSLRLVEKIIENTAEGILVTDLDGNIIKVNRGFLSMCEFAEEEVIGQNPRILKSGKHTEEFYKEMWEEIKNSGGWSGEIWNRTKEGAVYPKWLTINTITDMKGNPVYHVGMLTDISKLKDVESQLNYLAYYDSLTGLPNRTLFNERLKQSLQFNKRYKSRLAVFFIDLDRFKNINDALGHNYGDEYLVEISKRIKNRLRESDTVCRVGGDEFLLILDKVNTIDDVAHLASEILKVIKNPVLLADRDILSTASMGIALFPEDDDTEEGLIRKADTAMYLAKSSGKGSYKFFSQELEDLNNAKLDLEIKLRKALEENSFELFYQPQINIEKYLKGENSIIGCEALIRWRKEDGTLIPPDSFIPIAEETGMIIPIGKWVLKEACKTAARWNNAGTPIRVSANVSSSQFEDPDFLSYLDEAINESCLPPHLLHLELTESMLLYDLQSTVKLLNQIKDMGILFSIDDFGTGYSSLSYIKELPASNLKIDKGFIFKMDNSSQDRALVQVIISIAKTFGMTSIAEGVETSEHLNLLHIMGCEEIQGYYISKPLPLADFEKFLGENRNLK